MPRFVNYVFSKDGSTKPNPRGAAIYGYISGFDAFFTFLSVNLVGVLSDVFGRKPFMIYSAVGLGSAYLIASLSDTKSKLGSFTATTFFLAASLDGLTSCMFSQAQSMIVDLVGSTSKSPYAATTSPSGSSAISIALGKFQGIVVGCSFFIGIPIGAILGKRNIKYPLYLASTICLINSLLIKAFLPESNQHVLKARQQFPQTIRSRLRAVSWKSANPIGALQMLKRTHHLALASIAYCLLNIAHSGITMTWINYLTYKLKWSSEKAGSTLVLVGLVVAALPQLLINVFKSMHRALAFGLLTHAFACVFLAVAKTNVQVYTGTAFLAAGASTLPLLLGHLTNQVSGDEIGALQGAADTVRTISTLVASPLVSWVFSRCLLSEEDGTRTFGMKLPIGGALLLCSTFSFLAFVLFLLDGLTHAHTAHTHTHAHTINKIQDSKKTNKSALL